MSSSPPSSAAKAIKANATSTPRFVNDISAALVPGRTVYFAPHNFSDCVLVYGKVRFAVHRALLARGSTHFATLLQPPYDGTPVEIPNAFRQRFQLDPSCPLPSGIYGPASLMVPRVAHPKSLLIMLAVLYRDMPVSVRCRPPKLQIRADGDFDASNELVPLNDVFHPKEMFDVFEWHRDWDCSRAIDWGSLKIAMMLCPIDLVEGYIQTLWYCELLSAPEDVLQEMRKGLVQLIIGDRQAIEFFPTLSPSSLSSQTLLEFFYEMQRTQMELRRISGGWNEDGDRQVVVGRPKRKRSDEKEDE